MNNSVCIQKKSTNSNKDMQNRGSKITDFIEIVFMLAFFALIIIPIITINLKTNQVSEIDNRALAEFPKVISELKPASLEDYLEDRIGFRDEMITAYQVLCDRIFKKMVHPSYMYGKEGHVFFKDKSYTNDYQHLNLDKKYVEACTSYLEQLDAYCESVGSDFLYVLLPDKKSVYAEYFPGTYNVYGNVSLKDMLIEELKKTEIQYLFPLEDFLQAKDDVQLYNVVYDAAHWNENGAFLGHSIITEKLKLFYPKLDSIRKEDYIVSYEQVNSLLVSHFTIDEKIPKYRSVNHPWTVSKSIFSYIKCKPDAHSYVVNESIPDRPKLLLFHDSYFNSSAQYYAKNFSEVLMLHSKNLEDFQYYVSAFKPDIVMLESVERVLGPNGFLPDKLINKPLYNIGVLNSTCNNITPTLSLNDDGLSATVSDKPYITISGTIKSGEILGTAVFVTMNGNSYGAKYNVESAVFELAVKQHEIANVDEIIITLIDINGHRCNPVTIPIKRQG